MFANVSARALLRSSNYGIKSRKAHKQKNWFSLWTLANENSPDKHNRSIVDELVVTITVLTRVIEEML